MGSNPASANRRTGVVFFNKELWKLLSSDARRFILYHEEGHIVLNTRDEEKADAYAFEKYRKEGGSLRATVEVLSNMLKGKGQKERIENQIKRALIEDYGRYGNKAALKQFKRIVNG